MSAGAGSQARPHPRDPVWLLREAARWLRKNVPQTIAFALIGAAGGWLVNVYIMARQYDGFAVPAGAATPGRGNVMFGTITWVLVSSILFGLVAYRRAVGAERFWRDLRALPGLFATMFAKDGAGRVHFLWGLAVALVLTQFLTPSISGALAIGLALSIPSVLGRVALGLAVRGWHAIARAVQPGKRVRPPPVLAPAVTGLGTASALLLGFLIDDLPTKLALAAIAAAIALGAGRRLGPAAGGVGVLALVVIAALVDAGVALADDGGWVECGRSWSQWLRCQGTDTVLLTALWGGGAAAAGGVIGGALGGLFAGLNVPPSGSDSFIRWLQDLLEEDPELYDRFWEQYGGGAEPAAGPAADAAPTDAWGRPLEVHPETGEVWWGYGDPPRYVSPDEYERLVSEQRREHGIPDPDAPVMVRDPWGHEVQQVGPGEYWAWWLEPPRVVSADELPGALQQAQRIFADEQAHQDEFRRQTLEEAERDWQRRRAEQAAREAEEEARRQVLHEQFDRRMEAVTRLLEEGNPELLDDLDQIWLGAVRGGGATQEDLDALRALHQTGFRQMAEENERTRAEWERIASNIQRLETGARVAAFAGRVAGTVAETALTGGATRGAITGAIFGAAENVHRGAASAAGNALLGGASSYLGGRLEEVAGGGAAANVASNMVANAIEEGIRSGGDREAMRDAAIIGGLGGLIGRGITRGAAGYSGAAAGRAPAPTGDLFDDAAAGLGAGAHRGTRFFGGLLGRGTGEAADAAAAGVARGTGRGAPARATPPPEAAARATPPPEAAARATPPPEAPAARATPPPEAPAARATPPPEAPAARATPPPEAPAARAGTGADADIRSSLDEGVSGVRATGAEVDYPVAAGPGFQRYTGGVKPPPTDDALRNLRPGENVPLEAMSTTGYSPGQVAGLSDVARAENVIVGARTTQPASMDQIRRGVAEPKPVYVKPGTANEVDQLIGGPPPSEAGRVALFESRPPDPADPRLRNPDGSLNERLYDAARGRHQERQRQWNKYRQEIEELEAAGRVKWDRETGVIMHQNGKPFAGDIDPVYIRDAHTGEPVTGERYQRVKEALEGSGALVQHGAETNVVADLARGHAPGTPEHAAALAAGRQLHDTLAQQYTRERPAIVVEMWPDGVLRRGAPFQLTSVEG